MNTSKYIGKRVILISPIFYDYHTQISNRLTEWGAEVYFFPERRYDWKYSALKNLSQKLVASYQRKHYDEILKDLSTSQFDYLFVIKGSEMPIDFVGRLKQFSPNIKAVLYQWDSLNVIDYKYLIPSFDKVYSFDFNDVEKTSGVEYISLFCTDEMFVDNPNQQYHWDLFFVSAYSYDRYNELLKIIQLAHECNKTLYYRLLITPRKYFKEKYIYLRPLQKTLLSFEPLGRKEYLEAYFKSGIIIDYCHTQQSGLTMRSTEAIGSGKKLMTTNPHIKEVSDKSDGIIYEIGIGKEQINSLLVNTKAIKPNRTFSLDNWIQNIFRDFN